MMGLKKLLSGVVGFFMVASLVACGGANESNGADSETAEWANAERVQEAELEIFIIHNANLEWLERGAEIYNERFGTEITLNPVDVGPALPMVQKITPMLVANETMPDLIFLQDNFAASIFNQFEERFHSVEDFGFIEEFGDDFLPQKMNLLRHTSASGRINGFPMDIGTVLMYVNYALWEEAGIDIESVTTWDEMIEAGKQLKEETGRYLLAFNEVGEQEFIRFLTESQGVNFLDNEGNVNLLDPAVIRAYEVMQQLIDADLILFGTDVNILGQDNGLILQGSWFARHQMNNFPEDSGNWRVMSLPAVNEGEETFTALAGGSAFYVPENSQNALAAMQFMSFMMTDAEALDAALELMLTPSFMPAFDSELAQTPFEYYGGQPLLYVIFENTLILNDGLLFPFSADLNSFVQSATFQIWEGTPVEEALSTAAFDFAGRYGLDVNHVD